MTASCGDLSFTCGEDLLTRYQFNTMQAEHYFCSKCGIYTHHRRRSNKSQYGINAACLIGVSPFDLKKVPVYDGVTHPDDLPSNRGYRIVGYLTYDEVDPAA